MFYLKSGITSFVVLSSSKTATDLLDKRSMIYSDRPSIPMIHLTGFSRLLTRTPSSHKWFHTYRKIINNEIGPKGIAQHYELQEEGTRNFLKNLLKTPEDFRGHIKTFVIATNYVIRLMRR